MLFQFCTKSRIITEVKIFPLLSCVESILLLLFVWIPQLICWRAAHIMRGEGKLIKRERGVGAIKMLLISNLLAITLADDCGVLKLPGAVMSAAMGDGWLQRVTGDCSGWRLTAAGDRLLQRMTDDCCGWQVTAVGDGWLQWMTEDSLVWMTEDSHRLTTTGDW